MQGISSWIISIAGVCLMSIIFDLILPDGKMNKTIKTIFSYVVMLVVILPLPNLLNNNFKFTDVFSEFEIELQNSYIYNINQNKLDSYKKYIENNLNKAGIQGVVVSISANIFENNMKIDAVYVDLYNLVILKELENKNIQTEVIEIVLNVVDIPKEKVIFYE